MRLLVTGGAGFIGANFVHHVTQHHPEVKIRVLDALTYAANPRSLETLIDQIDLIVGDITNSHLVDTLVGDSDAVVHFAAETHVDRSLVDPAPFVHTNIIGTFTLLEAIRAHHVRFHHVSTDEVYGDLDFDDTHRFTSQSPLRPSNPYSATKAAGDLLVQSWVQSYQVAATISHCSNNYGPFQHIEKFIPRQITNILTGRRPKLYGTGNYIRDWIHVDDHNDAVWKILCDGHPGRSYLIGANGERSNLAVVQLILTLMGRDPNDFDVVDDRVGHDRRYGIDPTQLMTELQWYPHHSDFCEGLRQTIAWYQQNQSWWQSDKDMIEHTYQQLGH